MKKICQLTLLITLGGFLAACAPNQNHYIIAASGTVIGVQLGQAPADITPQAKLGYSRGEIAIVPTNRRVCYKGPNNQPLCEAGTGDASISPNVLMELYYKGFFSRGDGSGIYQRLAVGKIAVSQAGAAVLFAKDSSGKVDENAVLAAKALSNVGKIPDMPTNPNQESANQ